MTNMTVIRKWQMLIEGFFGRQQRQTKADKEQQNPKEPGKGQLLLHTKLESHNTK